jgi:hypothetical protein
MIRIGRGQPGGRGNGIEMGPLVDRGPSGHHQAVDAGGCGDQAGARYKGESVPGPDHTRDGNRQGVDRKGLTAVRVEDGDEFQLADTVGEQDAEGRPARPRFAASGGTVRPNTAQIAAMPTEAPSRR